MGWTENPRGGVRGDGSSVCVLHYETVASMQKKKTLRSMCLQVKAEGKSMFRCKSSPEVVQGHIWYSTQLCLTALQHANKHSTEIC